jgi:hypothetical protein
MDGVRDQEVAWLRQESTVFGTLRYAIPGGFEAYGALDLPRNISPIEEPLLDTLASDESEPLIAGWIDRGPWPPPPGDEHVLYSGWRYRLRRVAPSEVAGLPTEGEGSFPDLLFPPDRTWLVSLLWDDAWRSIGASQIVADQLSRRLANFTQLDPNAKLADTGRVPT